MSPRRGWGRWDATDRTRRARRHLLDTAGDGMHSALVPPGALHHRVTAALANWQLDDAEELLAGVERDPTPYAAPEPGSAGPADGDPARALGRAWADTLRAAVAGADWGDLHVTEPVTVSIGVASAPASEEGARVGWRALFDTADLHLFSAKRSGRNRVRAPGGAPAEGEA